MSRSPLHNIDDYDRFLGTTLGAWTPARRTAFAAAMADRWLPVYTAFSKREEWGDPDSLRRSVDAAWGHARGQRLGAADLARHLGLIRESMPHMDDFDAPEALAAAAIVMEAIESCRDDNLAGAGQAGLSAFEAIVPDWSLDPAEQQRLWERAAVRKEMEKQLTVIERLVAIVNLDGPAVDGLRRDLVRRGLAGEVPRRKAPSAPALRTNQDLFEQYRAQLELEARSRPKDWTVPGASNVTLAILLFGEWVGRYGRRRNFLAGKYGKLADSVGQAALVARQRARDLEPSAPDWDPEVREMIDQCVGNPMLGLDVDRLEAPHGHGPSVRRLWAEAKRAGRSDDEAWRHVIAWARHRPAVWDEEDRRRKRGLAFSVPVLGAHLARDLTWTLSGDPGQPWAAEVEGSRWRVRLNDFPDEIMYTLVIDDAPVGDFHDWPERWRRP